MRAIIVPDLTKTGRDSKKWFAVIRVLANGNAAAYNPDAGSGDMTPICINIESARKHVERVFIRSEAKAIAAKFNSE